MLNQPSLIVIIDVWAEYKNGHKTHPDLANRIINFIETQDSLHTAVLAPYFCRQEIESQDIWSQNNKKTFGHLPAYQRILESYYHEMNLAVSHSTHPLLLNYVNKDVFQISMRQMEELRIYLHMHPKIKNIYVSGEAWEVCVKIRSLGYESLFQNFVKNSDRNLLVHADTVGGFNGPPDIGGTAGWYPVSEKVFRYFI